MRGQGLLEAGVVDAQVWLSGLRRSAPQSGSPSTVSGALNFRRAGGVSMWSDTVVSWVLGEPLEQRAGHVEVQQARRPDRLRPDAVAVVQLVAVPVQLLEDPDFSFLDIAPVPDEVDLGVERPGQLPADGPRHDLRRAPRRDGGALRRCRDRAPGSPSTGRSTRSMSMLPASRTSTLRRMITSAALSSRMNARRAWLTVPRARKAPGLVQLDRHHLQAFQVIQAQYLLAIDEVVFHPPPRLLHRFPRYRH